MFKLTFKYEINYVNIILCVLTFLDENYSQKLLHEYDDEKKTLNVFKV